MQDLSDLRGLQDWYLRYELTAVEGVSEVASIGGFVKQYQVVVDPVRLLAYELPLHKVKMAINRSNVDVGGRVIEMSETEYMVRGLGYLGSMTDKEIDATRRAGGSVEEERTQRVLDGLGKIALGVSPEGTPIYLRDVADVRIGPEIRRGIAEWNGEGETVGGIIVMRFGENARATIDRARTRLRELEKGLPPGVAIKIAYDRSDLIDRAMNTLTHTLIEEIVIVSLICILFLIHARSALVAILVLPMGVLMTLATMYLLDLNANILSLGGIAIAIGVMVDSSIIMVENAHKHLERDRHLVEAGQTPRSRTQLITEAAIEVGPSLFFALLIITVSFLPIFALGEQSGRLFKPLAYTKTFSMIAGALLAVTIIPILMVFFVSERVVPRSLTTPKRLAIYIGVILAPAVLLALMPLQQFSDYRWLLVGGWLVLSAIIVLPQKIINEHRNPISRFLEWVYNPAFALVMRFRWFTLLAAVALMASTLWPLSQLGSEFMPPLEEGDLLYMPTTDPGLSAMKARELLEQTDKLIMQFPEVQTVFGKIGRAETATDPAPLTMIETTITLHRDQHKWRHVPVERFWGHWPRFAQPLVSWLFPDSRPITIEELAYGYDWPDGTHFPGLNEVV
ncbi:MAG: efflux RND transporter permease subunit, partial [Acidimicrobiia bacterium]|nr:efflux RND transporter permease subunit [Acidimicrobiia bacterium]